MAINFEQELGHHLVHYRDLERLCDGAPAESVFGEALDAGAGTLAIHIAAVTDKHGLTEGMMEVIFDFQLQRYGGAMRDSLALAPVLALIDSGAEPELISTLLVERDFLQTAERPGPHQGLDEAEQDLKKLLTVTGDGGVWGDVFFAARTAAEDYVDSLRSGAAESVTRPTSP